MTKSRAKTAIANSVVGLTKHLMRQCRLSKDKAYMRLYTTETFRVLNDPRTRLFLEPNAVIIKLLGIEQRQGVEAFYNVLSKI